MSDFDIKQFIEKLAKESIEEKKKALTLIEQKIGNEIAKEIIRQGEQFVLKVGDIIFEEGSVKPKIGNRSEVFFIIDGEISIRSRLLETAHKSTQFGKSEMVGDEKILHSLNLKNGERSIGNVYRSSAIVTINNSKLVGLSADDCITFFKYNSAQLVRLLKDWLVRYIQVDEFVGQVVSVARGMEIDFQKIIDARKIIMDLIEDENFDMIAGTIISLKNQLDKANEFFLEIEQEQRVKDKKFNQMREDLASTQAGLREFMSLLSGISGGVIPAEISDEEINSALDSAMPED